jgi:pSer/pThr/pTyr-binding forkhead associated (FHA) protein
MENQAAEATSPQRVLDLLPLVDLGLKQFVTQVPDPVLRFSLPSSRRDSRTADVTLDLDIGQTSSPQDAARHAYPEAANLVYVPVRKKPTTLGPEIWIGRTVSCDIVLPIEGISRVHAAIVRQDGERFMIADLASRNGTLVNGTPLADGMPHPLDDDALIMFGDHEVTFLLPETLFNELVKLRRR